MTKSSALPIVPKKISRRIGLCRDIFATLLLLVLLLLFHLHGAIFIEPSVLTCIAKVKRHYARANVKKECSIVRKKVCVCVRANVVLGFAVCLPLLKKPVHLRRRKKKDFANAHVHNKTTQSMWCLCYVDALVGGPQEQRHAEEEANGRRHKKKRAATKKRPSKPHYPSAGPRPWQKKNAKRNANAHTLGLRSNTTQKQYCLLMLT